MTTARYGAAAAALSDGRVLVAGGRDGSGNATASAEVYDASANTWTPVAPMGSARAFAAAAPLPDDRVLVAGGEIGGVASNSAEIFDGATGTWSSAAPMLLPRDGAVAAALPDGTVWVAGGSSASSSEDFNPTIGDWSASIAVEPRLGAAAAPLGNGGILVAGGIDAARPTSPWPWEIEKPPTNVLGVGSPQIPLIDEGAAAPLPGGRVLLAGGVPTGSIEAGSSGAEVFDSTLMMWSTVAPMDTARYGAVAAALPDGRILVAGGEGAGGTLASAEAYSPPVVANLVAPVLRNLYATQPGTARVGDQLSASAGSWSGNVDPLLPGYSFQWQRCLATCENIASPETWPATSQYAVTTDDVGAMLRVVVTAMDATGGTASAVSNEIGPVPAPGVHLQTLSPSDYQLLWRSDRPYLWVVVDRDGTSGVETVSLQVWDPNAGPHPIFSPITKVLQIPGGQSGTAIPLPVQDHGVPIMPGTLEVAIYDGSPLPVVAPSTLTIPMSAEPAQYVRNATNPLGLPFTPSAGNPLAGGRFFTDYLSRSGANALAVSASEPGVAAKLAVIAREPNTERFGAWNGKYPGWNVATYLDQAAKEEPGTVPLLSTYRIVDGHCNSRWSDPPADRQAYHDWITSLAEGIGPHPAVLFLEMDSLITAGCLSPQGVRVRMHELHDAIDVLSNDPHLVVYLDAGAADALPARAAAKLLREAGVGQIQGFFLNSTHFDWTSHEIRYGEKISRLTGGKHFVINTAENGQGPLRARHPATQGNEVLCDPPGRGLGPLPTMSTGYRNVDAFAWIANPGVSGGQCRRGAPPSGVFWPALALELVHYADFKIR
jgi:endoglucanase